MSTVTQLATLNKDSALLSSQNTTATIVIAESVSDNLNGSVDLQKAITVLAAKQIADHNTVITWLDALQKQQNMLAGLTAQNCDRLNNFQRLFYFLNLIFAYIARCVLYTISILLLLRER